MKTPDFEIKEEYLEIKLYGNTHKVRLPTCEEQEDFSEKVEQLNKETAVKPLMNCMRLYLENLGIPQEVTKKMPMGQFMKLVRFINEPKKD